jgi:glycerol-3-phosphate dehydrogenase (NAD(P)+)
MVEERIAIIGAGSMGTALGKMLGENGFEVLIWAFEPEVAEEINSKRLNTAFLGGFELPSNMRATTLLSEALDGARFALSATPAQALRSVWSKAREFVHPDAVIVSVSKGIEAGTARLMSEVFLEVFGTKDNDRFAFVSGPSFAREMALGHPTAVVAASTSSDLAKRAQTTLSTSAFRVYTTDDVIGVEMGGALKNVIAVGVGAAEGIGLGYNSRAALITRGLAEISRLAVTCGANPLTLAGLAGVGDLVLTCTGHLSRNLQVGIRLGRGESLPEILSGTNMVAEGVETTRSSLDLAKKLNVEMPISGAVGDLLRGAIAPEAAVGNLMGRKLRSEREF